jgi:hypothetical protein
MATLRTSLYNDEATKLREAIAEFFAREYCIKYGWSEAMRLHQPWPGNQENTEMVNREDNLYALISLLLDETKETHRDLMQAIDVLHQDSSTLNWNEHRDEIARRTRFALATDAENIFALINSDEQVR